MTFFKRFMLCFVLAVIAVCGLVSCKSREYYVDRAAEDARQFALENMRDLTPIQQNYIRYNKPVLMAETYMGRELFNNVKPIGGNDFGQMCAVWEIPGEELPVIVFGPTDHGIRGWVPNRIIRRNFRTKEFAREAAIKNAMLYAMNNMLFLSTSDRNRIRFSPPDAFITNYPLDVQGRNTDLQDAVKDSKVQVSFNWSSDEAGRKIVVSGMCNQDFVGFITVTGLLRTEEDIKEHTLSPATIGTKNDANGSKEAPATPAKASVQATPATPAKASVQATPATPAAPAKATVPVTVQPAK